MNGVSLDHVDREFWEHPWPEFCRAYPDIEKWQRVQAYEDALGEGMSHEEALRVAKETPGHLLPHIVFEVAGQNEKGNTDDHTRCTLPTEQ